MHRRTFQSRVCRVRSCFLKMASFHTRRDRCGQQAASDTAGQNCLTKMMATQGTLAKETLCQSQAECWLPQVKPLKLNSSEKFPFRKKKQTQNIANCLAVSLPLSHLNKNTH